MFVVSSL